MLKLRIGIMIVSAALLVGASALSAAEKAEADTKPVPAQSNAKPASGGVESLVAAGQSASSNASTAADDKTLKVNPSDYVKDGVGCGVPGLQTTSQ
jgi:hypothetical protein